jgi:hypothetical protein
LSELSGMDRPGLIADRVSGNRLADHIRKRAVCTVDKLSLDADDRLALLVMLGLTNEAGQFIPDQNGTIPVGHNPTGMTKT